MISNDEPIVEPLQETFKRSKLNIPIKLKVPDRDISSRYSIKFSDGCYTNMMNSCVNHEYDPIFDPSAEHLVPCNFTHQHEENPHPSVRAELILPPNPYSHACNICEPIIYDAPIGMRQMTRSTHDQWTANPPTAGVTTSLSLLQ